MTTNAVIDSNTKLIFAGQVRETLCINGFYTKGRLEAMGASISNGSSDIIGFETNEELRTIRFKLSKKQSDKYGMSKLSFYYADSYNAKTVEALRGIITQSYPDMVSMFGHEKVKDIYGFSNIAMLFTIQCFGNVLIITF